MESNENNSPKGWRRWFRWIRIFRFVRFGIKALLFIMFVVCVFLAYEANRCGNQAELCKILRPNDQLHEPRLTRFISPDGFIAATFGHLFGNEWKRDLTGINIYPQHSRGDAPIDRRVIKRMAKLERLETLMISNVLVTDADLEVLKEITTLKKLVLVNIEWDSSKIDELKKALHKTEIIVEIDSGLNRSSISWPL